MSERESSRTLASRKEAIRLRTEGSREQLAEALEKLASILMQEVDLLEAATTLEEAATLWSEIGTKDRQGNCLILAASSRRLAGDLTGARRVLEKGLGAELPSRLKDGFDVEWCEQELANGRPANAYNCFTHVINRLADELEPMQLSQLYQRRAAAATANRQARDAADDFLQSATIFKNQGFHADAEASALAAAAVLAEDDPDTAESIMSQIYKTVPADGAAAARRGLVGGKVALEMGNLVLALMRFDQARQGALDVREPISYRTAAVEASHAAESLGDFETAYARLATGWASLSDILGRDIAAQMMRPELEGLRERIGTGNFAAVKQEYEKKRRS